MAPVIKSKGCTPDHPPGLPAASPQEGSNTRQITLGEDVRAYRLRSSGDGIVGWTDDLSGLDTHSRMAYSTNTQSADPGVINLCEINHDGGQS